MRATPIAAPFAAALALLPGAAEAQQAQRPSGRVAITSQLDVAGTAHANSAEGTCYHYPQRDYFGQPAEVWSVSFNDVRSRGGAVDVRLNVTRPKSGTETHFILNGMAGRAGMLKANVGQGPQVGRGTVTVARDGERLVYTLDLVATDLTGRKEIPIEGTITCARVIQR